MGLQEEMFTEVEAWYASGLSKLKFLQNKSYSQAKFNYWLSKWKVIQASEQIHGFREVDFSETNFGKILEIKTLSGVKITIFA